MLPLARTCTLHAKMRPTESLSEEEQYRPMDYCSETYISTLLDRILSLRSLPGGVYDIASQQALPGSPGLGFQLYLK